MFFVSAVILAALTSQARVIDLRWQDSDSPATALFKRQSGRPNPNDPNFASNYPAASVTPPTNNLPKAWTDKLASIQLPNFGPSTNNNGYPTYAGGVSGADPSICSFTYACTASDDLYNPPDGTLALAFDDGPAAGSDTLYAFLQQNNASAKATHFMIGGSILNNVQEFQKAVSMGGHIAVHTWSHPYMTPLTNEQVLAELGWTMQIISDLNGGRLPRFWRPPFGDVDNRVRAIAKGVFGLSTVPWNQDTGDWAIGNNPAYTTDSVNANFNNWLTGSKKPGLNVLEHELNSNTVGIFMNNYPKMLSNGWKVVNVADAWSMPWYQNTNNGNTGAVTPQSITGGSANVTSSSNSSSSANATSSTSSATANMTSTSTSMSASTTSTSSSTSSSSSATAGTAAAAVSSKSAAKPLVAGSGILTGLGMMLALLA